MMNYSQVLEKYDFLSFSDEQKSLVVKYEKLKSTSSFKNALSNWEEWNLEEIYFSDILDKFRWEMYLNKVSEDKAAFAEELKLGDNNLNASLLVAEELLWDLKKNIKEWFVESIDSHFLRNFVGNEHRIAFLKEEYRRYIEEQREEILLNHMRWSRAYCPNELKIALLNNERNYVLPDYYSFKEKMSPDVKAVAEIVEKRFRGAQPDALDRILIYMEHLLGPSVENSYVNEELKADAYFVETRTSRLDKLMSALLVDGEFYGIN